MQNLYFSLPAGITLRLASNTGLRFGERDYLLARAYVPGLKLIKSSKLRRADITIEHRESAKKQFIRRGSRIIISDIWKGECPLDLYHLMYSAARLEFLKRGLYSVHAACAGVGGQILVVGHTGAGKTSIILELIRTHQARIFSGNKTVLAFKAGGIKALAGTPTITIGAAHIRKYAGLAGEAVDYSGRTAFLLKDENYAAKPEVPIAAVAIARLNDGVKECGRINPLSALHSLYPYFLDKVNADTIMLGGKNIFLGTPPPGASEALVQNLKRALIKIPVYTLAGSLEFVANSIAKL